MGSSLFSWATDLKDLCSTSDFSQLFENYFMKSDVCLWTFLIGLGIALVVAAIFYFGICNTSYPLSTRLNWIVALIACGVITFFISKSYVIGHDGGTSENSSGIYQSSYTMQDEYGLQIEEDDEQLAEWNALCDEFRTEVGSGGFDIFNSIALFNTIYALVFFILLSVCFKGTTTHGKNIPF